MVATARAKTRSRSEIVVPGELREGGRGKRRVRSSMAPETGGLDAGLLHRCAADTHRLGGEAGSYLGDYLDVIKFL